MSSTAAKRRPKPILVWLGDIDERKGNVKRLAGQRVYASREPVRLPFGANALGTWVVEFNLRGHEVKEAIPEARTRQQAEQAETNMRQAIYDRRFNRASGETLLSDFIKRVYEPHVRDNNRSWSDDVQRAGVIREFFGDRRMGGLHPLDFEKLKSRLRKTETKFKRKMSPATVNRYLFTASAIFALAQINGVVDSNPVTKVEKLQEPPPRDHWLSGDEEDSLLPALAEDGESMQAFGELPLHVGFRAGELLSRRWLHVSLGDAFVDIDETKNERPRRVPLNARALEILKGLRQGAADSDLILDPRRTGRRRRQLLYRFKAATLRAGLDDFHYHDLRHTFATRLRAAGVHEYDIADLLGHSTTRGDTRGTSVTRGYTHAVPSRLREAVELLCTSNVVEFRRKEQRA